MVGLDYANLVVVVGCDMTFFSHTEHFFQTQTIYIENKAVEKFNTNTFMARKFGKKIEDNNRFILVDMNLKKMCLARNSNLLYFVFR